MVPTGKGRRGRGFARLTTTPTGAAARPLRNLATEAVPMQETRRGSVFRALPLPFLHRMAVPDYFARRNTSDATFVNASSMSAAVGAETNNPWDWLVL